MRWWGSWGKLTARTSSVIQPTREHFSIVRKRTISDRFGSVLSDGPRESIRFLLSWDDDLHAAIFGAAVRVV
jgi:hypothetical protein